MNRSNFMGCLRRDVRDESNHRFRVHAYTYASTTKKKHSEEDLCLVVQTGTSQPVQTHKKSLQVYVTQDHPDEFWAFEVMKDVPMNKKEMIELLYDYVMAIQDEQC